MQERIVLYIIAGCVLVFALIGLNTLAFIFDAEVTQWAYYINGTVILTALGFLFGTVLYTKKGDSNA